MKKRSLAIAVVLVLIGLTAAAGAQTPGEDRVTVPFSDPSRPGTVKVNLLSGGITVKSYSGKEVVIQAKAREEKESRRHAAESAGMKRITNTTTGLTVDEEENVVSIGTGLSSRAVDINIQVPTRTGLKLKTVNDGDIIVEQVQGEIEVQDINGGVTLTQVSGSVIAHALNGNVKVTLAAVAPDKPMSFSSLNGDIDVTFPPGLKANVVMKTDNGEVFSDFDVQMNPSAAKPVTEDAKGKGGKYHLRLDRNMYGTINGGGPEIQFKTMNGNIYIRKSK